MTIFCIKEQEIDGYVFKETSKNVNLELGVIRGSDTGELLILFRHCLEAKSFELKSLADWRPKTYLLGKDEEGTASY